MSIDELIFKIDKSKKEELDENKLENLLNAINDWPNEISTTEEYFSEIKRFLDLKEINLVSVTDKIKLLNNDNNFVWELESLYEFIIYLKKNPAPQRVIK